MQREVKAGRSDQADESNSTEHDVTVSLSGTDEFNDTQSVFSDGLSAVSKASKLNDARKVAHKMNKLKEENMLLKEALEKANASDITMLKSKLRGSHADLVRLRQNNSELKDRIQVLEGRLFSALSLQTTKISNIVESAPDAVKTTDQPQPPIATFSKDEVTTLQDSKFTSSERAHLMDTVKSQQARCKHLARLVQSYEAKISVMQAEADARAAPGVTAGASGGDTVSTAREPSSSIEFNVVEQEGPVAMTFAEPSATLKSALKGSTGKPYNSSTSKAGTRRQVQIDPEQVEARIANAREGDLKMLRELSEEVKRLVALLPRERIASDERAEYNGTSEDSPSDNDASVEGTVMGSKASGDTSITQRSTGQDTGRQVVRGGGGDSGTAAGNLYSPGQLLASFFAGVLVMLLCVALSAYSTYYSVADGTTGAIDGTQRKGPT